MKTAQSRTAQIAQLLSAAILATAAAGCDKEQPSAPPAASTAVPAPEAAAPPPVVSATASAAAVAKPSRACPEGATGEGTAKAPCEAKGASRMMEVKWTGKMGDKGPSFRVVNNSKLEILYGSVVVYFYDKAGKQLTVAAGSDSARQKQACSGNIFEGPMKAGEKAVITFSCVNKSHVPEGAVAIEAEMQMVGFTEVNGAKADTFWRNNDLAPDARPKAAK